MNERKKMLWNLSVPGSHESRLHSKVQLYFIDIKFTSSTWLVLGACVNVLGSI